MSRTAFYTATDCSEYRRETVLFGALTDARGRSVGARITRYEFTAVPVEAHEPGCYALPEGMDGRVYAFAPQAIRDGNKYGALQPRRFFPTLIEREAAIITYLRSAVNRAVKQFPAKQEG